MALRYSSRAIVGKLSGNRSILTRNMCAATSYQFDTLNVTNPKEYVFNVELNRPKKLNAFLLKTYWDLAECFKKLTYDENCRVIVVSGAGRAFTAGIDVMDLAENVMAYSAEVGRKAFHIRKILQKMQESHTLMEKCPKPVLAACHSFCIGAGVDMITACDMRYCTKDTYYQVKEVDVGLAADVGTLHRLPKVMGNDSLVRELCYTARKMYADEALQHGFVSRVFDDKDSMMSGVMDIATEIASKSPIAVQGTKVNLIYARDHSVQDGLDFITAWNIGMLQSEDTVKAGTAAMTKEKPTFAKL